MRHSQDKNKPPLLQNEADMFNQMINHFGLIELPLLDRVFTWTNNHDDSTLERIDRVFNNHTWDSLFPYSSMSSLTQFISDHVPLIIVISSKFPVERFLDLNQVGLSI